MKTFNYFMNFLLLILPNMASAFFIDSTSSAQSELPSKNFYNDNYLNATNSQRINHGILLCTYDRDELGWDQDIQTQCCKKTVENYHQFWLINSLPLNRYLAFLQHWNCTQFEGECERRLFSFNRFTDLMYDYFCDYNKFVSACLPNVANVVNANSSVSEARRTDKLDPQNETLEWKKVISQLQPSILTLDELMEPCVQVAQYDQEELHDGSYQEIVDFFIPSCGISWCAFGEEALKSRIISVWTCLSPK